MWVWEASFLASTLFATVSGAPLPQHKHAAAERFPHVVHLKEESPFYCSRAVSRWVRDAWELALKPLAKLPYRPTIDTGEPQPTSHAINPSKHYGSGCPFNAKNDWMREQELMHRRDKSSAIAPVDCKSCNKQFKSLYYFDRHLDRSHSIAGGIYKLPADYTGGPVRALVLARSQGSTDPRGQPYALTDPEKINAFLKPPGMCLEPLCPIFDVCDRPVDGQAPLIRNNYSITFNTNNKAASYDADAMPLGPVSPLLPKPRADGSYPASRRTLSAAQAEEDSSPVAVDTNYNDETFPRAGGLHSSNVRDGECNSMRLHFYQNYCYRLVDSCFDVSKNTYPANRPMSRADFTIIRAANSYMKANLCTALVSCEYYMSRRRFSGSSRKYTEAAFKNEIARPLTAWAPWELALLISGSVLLLSALGLVFCCCVITGESSIETRRLKETRAEERRARMHYDDEDRAPGSSLRRRYQM